MPTKDPKHPEHFTFKLFGMEVSGTGRLPVVCAVIFAAVMICAVVAQAVGW